MFLKENLRAGWKDQGKRQGGRTRQSAKMQGLPPLASVIVWNGIHVREIEERVGALEERLEPSI
jgi:hypothetical protein